MTPEHIAKMQAAAAEARRLKSAAAMRQLYDEDAQAQDRHTRAWADIKRQRAADPSWDGWKPYW